MYSAPPPPIDFAAYKAKITAVDVVDKLQVSLPSWYWNSCSRINRHFDLYLQENYMKLEYPTMADLEKAPVGTEKADIKTTAAKLVSSSSLVVLANNSLSTLIRFCYVPCSLGP